MDSIDYSQSKTDNLTIGERKALSALMKRTDIVINSLPTNDAYMRHEILYAKRPMTHIRVMTNDRSLTAKLHSREIPTLNIGVIMN